MITKPKSFGDLLVLILLLSIPVMVISLILLHNRTYASSEAYRPFQKFSMYLPNKDTTKTVEWIEHLDSIYVDTWKIEYHVQKK